MGKVLVVLGPTATGKTDLALQLAQKFNGELISCDSRQVYKGLDIGTGKDLPINSKFNPSTILRVDGEQSRTIKGQNAIRRLADKSQKYQIGYYLFDKIPVWMLDVADSKKQYSVADYVKHTEKVIEDILKRGKLPIIVGGTGLYLKALLLGLPNLAIPVDQNLREKLQKLSKEKLQKKLQQISPDKWKNLNESDRQNSRRLVRVIEIASTDFTSEESLRTTVRGGFKTLKIGLTASRAILYQRINARLMSRMDQGLVEEAERLHKGGLSFERMKQLGLEYGVLADLLLGRVNKDEFIEILATKIHQYAKRQITWFKKEKDIHWFDVTAKNMSVRVEREVKLWYNTKNDTPN